MNQMIDLGLMRSAEALQALAEKCRQDMKQRWPEVDFVADEWKIHTLYKTRMQDVRFRSVIDDFADKDPCYVLAYRCLLALSALDGKTKNWKASLKAWRPLQRQAIPLAALRRHHLRELEEEQVKTATLSSAATTCGDLLRLSRMLDDLARLEVMGHLAWSPSAENKAKLRKLGREASKSRKKHIDVLDRQIEALSDATKAMLLRDERLSAMDRSAIALANILMCAPSRINEPLCMRITDRYTIEDYAKRADTDETSRLHQAHQLLMMKGSKGAAWSPKPILNFMLGLSDVCWNVILELGERSRALLEHYEKTPDRLYLPPELEELRGKPVTKTALWQITNLTNRDPLTTGEFANSNFSQKTWNRIFKLQKGEASAVMLLDNPRTHRSDGRKNTHSKIPVLPWQEVETYLLDRVRERMSSMRRVTDENAYDGPLSEMLMLVDSERAPYLPQAWDADTIRQRLKTTPCRVKSNNEKSVFIKLGLQMNVGGKLLDCYLDTHDPRRWLSTQALKARERLSDVLINKWANRLDIRQLAAYDLRTAEQKADQAAAPVPEELQSISAGLKDLAALEDDYGLRTEIIVAQGDALTVTSMDAVLQATENRPVAECGNQIIILYPNRYGMCLHQHHETPCRAFGCAAGCNEQLTVKGHLPTNETWHRQEELTNRSIVNQFRALITARNRGVADEPAMLDAHLLTLVKGLNVQAMADELIERFHELKDRIKDLNFRNELEEAFVARGVVACLKDPAVPTGSLIKYHNPCKHASPGYERAIEAQCGGREEMEQQDALFHQKYPELAPRALGLKDERHFFEGGDADDDGEEDEQAA